MAFLDKVKRKWKNYIGLFSDKGIYFCYWRGHAALLGLVDGFLNFNGDVYEYKEKAWYHEDVRNHPHYYHAFFVISKYLSYAAAIYLFARLI